MTEAEWLASNDPEEMLSLVRSKLLAFVKRPASHRKLVLSACACYRYVWHLIPDEESRSRVESLESRADEGNVAIGFHEAAQGDAEDALANSPDEQTAAVDPDHAVWEYVVGSVRRVIRGIENVENDRYFRNPSGLHVRFVLEEKMAEICEMFRDIFGNPFLALEINPAWQTATVASLAETIYEDRAFDRMPILGDALEEAGCTNAEIMAHCRGAGPHVRGCWVVDLLLGKE